MRAFLPAVILVFGVQLAGGPAAAQEARRHYVSGFGGMNILMNPDVSAAGMSVGEGEFDQGFAFGGAVGLRFLDDFRAELEASYRQNDIDRLFTASGGGDATSLALMANSYYDFPDLFGSRRTPVRPYLGGGIGVARVAWNDVSVGATQITDDDEYIVAFQALAGVGIGVSDSVTLTVDYRFFATPDVELDRTSGSSPFQMENLNHTVTVGFRVEF